MKHVRLDYCDDDYIENNQKSCTAFAVGWHNSAGTYNQNSGWFKCRDFFCDLAFTDKTGHNSYAYGFSPESINWDGTGILFYIGKPREKVLEHAAIMNDFLKSHGLPPIVLRQFKNVGVKNKHYEVNYWATNSETCEQLYYVPLNNFWRASAFHLYMASSFLRSIWWQIEHNMPLYDIQGMMQKWPEQAELVHLQLFLPHVWPFVRKFVKAKPVNVLNTDANGLVSFMRTGDIPHDDEREYCDDEYVVENVHDVSGTTQVSNIVYNHGLVPWKNPDWIGRGTKEAVLSMASGPSNPYYGANNLLCRKINRALHKAREEGKIDTSHWYTQGWIKNQSVAA